ncbi:ATP-binding protein [Planctomycetota bacterium]
MSFKQIFSQDKAVGILQRAFAAEKVPHAYIFAGHEGVGKFTTARQWAKVLLCQNPVVEKNNSAEFANSCGACESCMLFDAGSHPDFDLVYKELRPFTRDGKSKGPPVDLPIDVIREFVIEKVASKPTLSKRKIFIVSEAEKLNASSQNALLKVLEEPPEYCCIILLCTRLEKLLPTTKSRCQIIRFSLIEENRIIEKLSQMGLDQKQAGLFARLAQGSIGLACQWAKLELNDANLYQTKKKLLNSVAKLILPDTLSLAQTFIDESKNLADNWAKLDENTSNTDLKRRAAKTLVRIIISALFDAMKLNYTACEKLINIDQKEQMKKIAGRFSPEQSAAKIGDCCQALRWIDDSVNQKLIFEHLLLNLAVSDRIKD